jgi:hypothetical protein
LHEITKLGVEDERAGLLVADELIFNGEPDATRGSARRHDVAEEIGGDGGVHPRAHGALHGVPVADVLGRGVEIDVISKGILAQGVEEETTPLAVLRRVAIKHDRHQSTEVLDRDGLSAERGGEGLRVGDDEHALGLGGAFGLCVSRGLLSLLPGGAFGIGLSHDEQVVATARVDSGSKVAGATARVDSGSKVAGETNLIP